MPRSQRAQRHKGWPIPSEIIPGSETNVCVTVPDNAEYKDAFLGALFELTRWYNYRRTDDDSGKRVADVWRDVWENIEWGSCGGEWQPPGTGGSHTYDFRTAQLVPPWVIDPNNNFEEMSYLLGLGWEANVNNVGPYYTRRGKMRKTFTVRRWLDFVRVRFLISNPSPPQFGIEVAVGFILTDSVSGRSIGARVMPEQLLFCGEAEGVMEATINTPGSNYDIPFDSIDIYLALSQEVDETNASRHTGFVQYVTMSALSETLPDW